MTVAWGLLSTARINRCILEAARKTDRVDVVAVGSRTPSRAEAYARRHGIEHAHGSYEALLEDKAVDAVYVSLPNSLHVEWTLRALEAGKHVLCEKPLSRNPKAVEQVFDRAQERGLIVSEGFMWRHHPQTSKLVELAAEEVIGRLRLVRAAFSFDVAAVHGAQDARLDLELDGGALMDVGSYCVNAIRLLAGEPERVQALQTIGPSGVDVCFAATLALPNEVIAHFDVGFVLPRRAALEVVGEDGTVFVADPWQPRAPRIELGRPTGDDAVEWEGIPVDRADSYLLELENVSGAIQDETKLLLGRADAIDQARALDALQRSASTGTAVELEPAAPAETWSVR
jgi:D-xylose 1-dehydrogenase (NADP+, D-xylono-1,5-lactone-forming)